MRQASSGLGVPRHLHFKETWESTSCRNPNSASLSSSFPANPRRRDKALEFMNLATEGVKEMKITSKLIDKFETALREKEENNLEQFLLLNE